MMEYATKKESKYIHCLIGNNEHEKWGKKQSAYCPGSAIRKPTSKDSKYLISPPPDSNVESIQ